MTTRIRQNCKIAHEGDAIVYGCFWHLLKPHHHPPGTPSRSDRSPSRPDDGRRISLAKLRPNFSAHNDVARIQSAFGPTLFIHLSRSDLLDQAISRLRAEQTGLWHRRADGTELERLAPKRNEGYDPETIKAYMSELAEFNAAWNRWFDEQSISPLKVSYDSLSKEPQTVLAEILAALGLDASLALTISPQTAKLADETNRDWRMRFEADYGPFLR